MPLYRLHQFAVSALPIVFAIFCARLVKNKSTRDLWIWGLGGTAILLIIAIVFPNIGVYYYYGPRASEGTDSLALPLSYVSVLGVQVVGRSWLPRWALIILGSIAGEWPIIAGSYGAR